MHISHTLSCPLLVAAVPSKLLRNRQTLPVLGWTSVGLLCQGPLVQGSYGSSCSVSHCIPPSGPPLLLQMLYCGVLHSQNCAEVLGWLREKRLFVLCTCSVKGAPKQSLDKSPFLPGALSPKEIHTHSACNKNGVADCQSGLPKMTS